MITTTDKTPQPRKSFLNPAAIAFGSLGIGALPIGAMGSGLYQVGMCDPAPLLALLWLGLFCLGGTGFGIWSIYRAETRGGRIAIPVLATLLNISGLFVPLWLLTK